MSLKKQLDEVNSRNAILESKMQAMEADQSQSKINYVAALDELALLKEDEGAALSLLSHGIVANHPSNAVQHFATQLITKCTVNGEVKLRTNKGRQIIYERVRVQRAIKDDAKPESRKRFLKKHAECMLQSCGTRGEDAVVALLKVLAKKNGLFVAERAKMGLSVAQSIVLRDHVKTSNNGLHRMKQCLEAFAPELKGVLLKPNIKKHVSNMEKQGVVPSRVVEVCCTTTKKGNRKGMCMCTFYFCSRSTQLLGNMLRRMFLDNVTQPSIDFSSVSNAIVVAVGFDKSDSDFVGT